MKTITQKTRAPTNKAISGGVGAAVGALVASVLARNNVIVGPEEIAAAQIILAGAGSFVVSYLVPERR